jgi:Pectate lyase superfamily protein
MARLRARFYAVVVVLVAAVLVPLGVLPAPLAAAATAPTHIYYARSYGAVCNGIPLGQPGSHDDTSAIQDAIDAAEATGGMVQLPAGTCELSTRLNMTSGQGITLNGRVSSKGQRQTTLTDSINPDHQQGDLYISSAHNTVQDLVMNQLLYGGVAEVQADYTTFQRTTLLGGPKFFVVYFHDLPDGEHAIGNQLIDSNVVSLIDRTVQSTLGTQPCDDGLSWAMQDDSLIQNVEFTGTRLALYQDDGVEVNGFTYHPGPQTCDLDGYWITQPSSNITLENLTMYGSGGVVDNDGSSNGISRNISIINERVKTPTAGTGYTLNGPSHGLIITNVDGVTISSSDLDSPVPANSSIQFQPSTKAIRVVVKNTIVPRVSFWSQSPRGSTVLGEVKASFNDDTFPQLALDNPNNQTFLNGSGGPTTFSVTGGTWLNDQREDVKDWGFAKGSNTAFTVSDLAGYDLPAYVQGEVKAASHNTLTIGFPSDVMRGDLLIGAFRTAHISSVSDNLNGAWTEAYRTSLLSVWYKRDAKPGPTAVTVSGSSGPTRGAIAEYFEWSLPNELMGASCQVGFGTAVSSGATVAVAGRDLVFGAVANSDKLGSKTVKPGLINGVPATLRLQKTNANGTIAVEDVTRGAGGRQDAHMMVASGIWRACVVVFGPRI